MREALLDFEGSSCHAEAKALRQCFETRVFDGVEIEGRRTKVGSEVVKERVDESTQLDFRTTPDRLFTLLTVLFFPCVLLGESSDLE